MPVKVGVIDSGISSGDATYHDVGFRPKALLAFMTRFDAGAFEVNADCIGGMASSASDQFCSTFYSQDNLGTSDANRYRNTDRMLRDLAGNLDVQLVGFRDDGFTLHYGQPHANENIAYMAFGGPIQAKVGNFLLSNTGTPQSITGVGFQPQAIIFMWAHDGANGLQLNYADFGMGFASSASAEACALSFSNDNQPNAQTRHGWWTDRSIAFGTNGTVVDRAYANVASFDADGFTLNVTDLAADATYRVGYLALEGLEAAVLTDTALSGATGAKSYTGTGFEPNGLIVIQQSDTADSPDLLVANALLSVGLTDGTDQVMLWHGDLNGPTTTEANQRFYTDHVAGTILPGSPPAAQALAGFTSFDADGWTAQWDTVGATAYELSYFAMNLEPEVLPLPSGNHWWWWRGF